MERFDEQAVELKAMSSEASSAPDTFDQASQEAEGCEARHPNRAQSEGAFEAGHERPADGWVQRCEPPLDEPPEQALDEALELTFPGSDPAAGPCGCTRLEIGEDGQPHEVASGALARAHEDERA